MGASDTAAEPARGESHSATRRLLMRSMHRLGSPICTVQADLLTSSFMRIELLYGYDSMANVTPAPRAMDKSVRQQRSRHETAAAPVSRRAEREVPKRPKWQSGHLLSGLLTRAESPVVRTAARSARSGVPCRLDPYTDISLAYLCQHWQRTNTNGGWINGAARENCSNFWRSIAARTRRHAS